jgi:transposase-like protein
MNMNLTRAPKCIACGSDELLSVSITMADGPVDFWTCSSCESTSWERSGGRVSREAALANLPRR